MDKAKDKTPQGRATGEDTVASFNERHDAQDDKKTDTGPVPPKSTVEHASLTTLSTDAPEETSDPILEKKVESFIEDTATFSTKEKDSKDKNQQSASRKVLKTEIGEQNLKDKSKEVPERTLL